VDSHEGNIKDVYHFENKLANGGFGIVYLASHRKTCKLLESEKSRIEICDKGHLEKESEGLYDF